MQSSRLAMFLLATVLLMMSSNSTLFAESRGDGMGPKGAELTAERAERARNEEVSRDSRQGEGGVDRPDRATTSEPIAQVRMAPGPVAQARMTGPSQQTQTQDAGSASGATANRQHIKEVTGRVLNSRGRDLKVTCEQRDDSAAHKRGAIDYRTKDIPKFERHEEAKELSKALGPGHTVVVEEVHRPEVGALGPSVEIHTAYRDGIKGKTKFQEPKPKAATHTHVQPERRPNPPTPKN